MIFGPGLHKFAKIAFQDANLATQSSIIRMDVTASLASLLSVLLLSLSEEITPKQCYKAYLVVCGQVVERGLFIHTTHEVDMKSGVGLAGGASEIENTCRRPLKLR